MGKMQKFKDYLSESISVSEFGRASTLIAKYLSKKLKLKLFAHPSVEKYTGKAGQRFGIRFYVPKGNRCFRFNWKSAGAVSSVNLDSIDYWDGKNKAPLNIQFDTQVSLVRALPAFTDFVKTGAKSKTLYIEPEAEAIRESVDESLPIQILNYMKKKSEHSATEIGNKFTNAGYRVHRELRNRYPDAFDKSGRKYVWTGGDTLDKDIKGSSADILSSIGAVRASVSRGSGNEMISVDPEVEAVEANADRLVFEKQLEDYANLLKMMHSGASNALFVAGRGGIGKTFTAEKELDALGLVDNKDYFKNTGSISAAGLYRLLFKYRNQIVFFDDSDNVFADQESRNILKAATDTKKIRKLVYSKRGSDVVEPDQYTDEEMEDQGLIPRYFEFTGKIIFISNLKPDKLDPDGALRTRAFLVNIDPTEEEVYDFMEKIVDNIPLDDGMYLDSKDRKYVVKLLREGKSKQSANLRKLSRGLNMYAGSLKAGVSVSQSEMERMISMYA